MCSERCLKVKYVCESLRIVQVELIGTAMELMAEERKVCISEDPEHPLGTKYGFRKSTEINTMVPCVTSAYR